MPDNLAAAPTVLDEPEPGVTPLRPDHRSTVQLEIVIPALNEERRIGATLAAVVTYLDRLPFSCRVSVVDNGSVDATAAVVQEAPHSGVDVRLIGCRDRGKGAAVRAGVLAARSHWVGFCDADLSTPVDALSGILAHLAVGAPVVIGSRRCAGAGFALEQPPVRRAGGWAFRRMTRSLVPGVADTQCGFKFFQLAAARDLFADVASAGFAFDLELLAAAVRRELDVVEVPVRWSDQDGSTLRPIHHGREVLREVRSLRRLADLAREDAAA